MKEKYIEPEMIITELPCDMIVTSGTSGNETEFSPDVQFG